VHALAAIVALLFQQPQLPPSAGPQPYFQQDIRFTTRARLDEPTGILSASGRLHYRNNSPDTLTTIAFHLYLNAFRPGSKWVAHQQAEDGYSPWASLPDPYYAYERLSRVVIGGVEVEAQYPGAPDSTVVTYALPRPLAPGDSTWVDLDWTARLSVIPRRQGRAGRRFDFAQWYPEVATYDRYGWEAHPLYPEGEFYGEYGTYDVTLDLAADQVCGATGVPVEGDPGWSAARASPETPVTLQSDWYGSDTRHLTPDTSPVEPGRKLVRFHAEQVEHFAFSCNPDYVYEEGRYGPTVIHVLYLPTDTAWAGGVAVRRVERALAWLDSLFGPYAWPQATALHRIEGGGTEFPMMVMLGGAGQGLILHEIGHLYTYGMLGNNEWKEGWLDEGFTSFQTLWAEQRWGMAAPDFALQRYVLGLDLDGWSQPVVLPAEQYSDYPVYGAMVYAKGQLIYQMLRYVLGEDTFRRAVREYYARYRFKHVSSEAFQQVCEEASHRDLGWFFSEWLHGTPKVDYALRKVRRRRAADGWVTDIEIVRLGDGVMPVDIAVPVGDTTLIVRARGMDRRETVEVHTAAKPGRVELDPARETMDWNYLNNLEGPHLPFRPLVGTGRVESRLGWSATTPARRDRLVVNWMPLAWYDNAGGVTVGFQSRSNYLGQFELNQTQLTWPTGLRDGPGGLGSRWRPDYYVSLRNPVKAQRLRLRSELATWSVEGRTGGRLAASRDLTRQLGGPETASAGASISLMTVTDLSYLDARRWDDLNTVEATVWAARSRLFYRGSRGVRIELSVGEAFAPVVVNVEVPIGAPGSGLYQLNGERALRGSTYLRGLLETRRSARIGDFDLNLRTVLAGVTAGGALPRQREIFLAGADPYETFQNPFLRSRGALFAGGAHYQAPGGGDLRGFGPDVSTRWLVGVNIEAGPRLVERPGHRLFSSVSLVGFADGALLDPRTLRRVAAGDLGLGLRAAHRIGPTSFVTRVDFPLLVSRASYAVGGRPGDDRFRFRAVWSLEEVF
jgi:hypothetical protein